MKSLVGYSFGCPPPHPHIITLKLSISFVQKIINNIIPFDRKASLTTQLIDNIIYDVHTSNLINKQKKIIKLIL